MYQFSIAEMIDFQKQDSDLKILYQWLEQEKLPSRDEVAQFSPAVRNFWLNWDSITLKDGILYRKLTLVDNKEVQQLLVPKILRQNILQMCHDNLFSAHQGVNKTIHKVKNYFYWYRTGEDIKCHAKQCPACNKWKKQTKPPRAKLCDYRVGFPLDRIGIDIIGPLPRTKKQNKFILVIGDHFTRWMEAFPIPNQNAETVATKLVHEFIVRYGTSLEIHTDQGTNFDSQLFKEVCSLLQIKKTRLTPYRPNSNGLFERFNQTLGEMIKSFIENNVNEWDKYLCILMAEYRSTPHPSTGYSANMLMLGRGSQHPYPHSVSFTS